MVYYHTTNLKAGAEENERLKRIIAKQALEIERGGPSREERAAKKNAYRAEEKLKLVKLYEPQVPRTQLCQWLDLPRSVSYYRPSLGKPGAKPSQLTLRLDGTWVPNQEVVEHIWKWLDDEFNAYGYEYVTHELKTDYVINKKKRGRPAVYRLMKEANLLMGKVFRPAGKREFVQFRRITATRPLEYL